MRGRVKVNLVTVPVRYFARQRLRDGDIRLQVAPICHTL